MAQGQAKKSGRPGRPSARAGLSRLIAWPPRVHPPLRRRERGTEGCLVGPRSSASGEPVGSRVRGTPRTRLREKPADGLLTKGLSRGPSSWSSSWRPSWQPSSSSWPSMWLLPSDTRTRITRPALGVSSKVRTTVSRPACARRNAPSSSRDGLVVVAGMENCQEKSRKKSAADPGFFPRAALR
jgi:hypothetical protein